MTHLPLILGSHGRLGRSLCDVIENEYAQTFPGAVFATRAELDTGDYWRLRSEFERIEPTVVVNCTAYAQVDGCETNRDLAVAANALGARHVARAAAAAGARVIQISTDLVFDGAKGRPYREEDAPNPLSHYARTKLEGEKAVSEENPDHVILRSSWFFGPWPENRYPEVFLKALQEGRRFAMVSDRIGSPTYLRDLARAIVHVIVTPHRGILHFANAGEPTSRYHLLEALARRLDISTAGMTRISDEQWQEDAAVRPPYSALDPGRYAEVTGHHPRTWLESLEEYVRERTGGE
ncbi:MAG TPA: dTDP-4-dehydrorhamnose reductase [Candidatus Polarisedimenticolia bacterium]|jgi:dTDP-4-dehydrorhamnose reductase